MYGVCTRNAEDAAWPDFDRAFYEVKAVSGRHADPIPDAASVVSCFADTATAETTPELVARDAQGRAATRDHPSLETGHVCPTDEHYREGVLETVADAAAVSGDVRLDEVGLPPGFCRCDRCADARGDADWTAWRTDALTEFVAEAAARVDGTTYLSLEPDPYPGHLRKRWGLDVDALAAHVDEFVVPLYDPGYETTYWLESLASGFADRLDAPVGVELYAAGVDVDALLDAVGAVEEYANHIYFGYDAGAGRAAIRRMRAERREGETHRP
ncbi:MAG: hypothetical protein ABEJ68_00570 [Halobacteriaceae archaeon]